jgi:hypothetical protein
MPQSLLARLTTQLVADGRPWAEARALAIKLLRERGQMKPDSVELTPKGVARQALGAAGRAKDRAAVAAGRDPSDYTYAPRTNRATLKKGR